MKLALLNVRIINPDQNLDETNSLLIENGVITKIGELSKEDLNSSEIMEYDGKICVPGLFDMHVHLREPGREDTETVKTGSNSAAAGGFTGVACMPNTNPAIDSAEVVKFIKEKSANHLVEVYPIGAVSKGRNGEHLAPIAELVEAGAVGFSDDGVAVKTASLVRNALEYLKMYDLPIIEHCEDESLAGGAMNEGSVSTQLGLPSIPTIAEDLTVMRDISVADYVDGRVHIAHISSKKAVDLVRQAKSKGIKVTAEVTPHHFTLTDEELVNYDTNYKMNPPLRTEEDVNAMIEGLKDGTIDCIASDHAPHSIEEKEAEFIYAPNGILGLETQLGISISELVHKNQLTINQLIEKLSINPRKILRIPIPQIKVGEMANLTIIDLNEVWTVDIKKFKSKSKNSPFDKKLLTGKSVAVINKCQMFKDGEFTKLN
ncbi:MAG: dihydroorotase [Ignavibacteriae bacterium]|nr:dihydroorotase [Ignavibacteriota bacterium]